MISLLDLNYTLVANNPARGTTPERMEKRLANEQYRQWLVELVRPHIVVIMTARPSTWMGKTLNRIEEQTGWRPQDAATGDALNHDVIAKCFDSGVRQSGGSVSPGHDLTAGGGILASECCRGHGWRLHSPCAVAAAFPLRLMPLRRKDNRAGGVRRHR
jgi:hypothetical protein